VAQFEFRLDCVLRLRKHIKDQKRWELRALYNTRRGMVAEIDALERELAGQSFNIAEGQIYTALELRLCAEHSQSLGKQIRAKRAALAVVNEKLAAKRAELMEATRAVKSLEQLRVRHEERYRRAQNIAEQRFADEIAQRKFAQPQNRKKIPN
jgi:flagellar export protein FliJ